MSDRLRDKISTDAFIDGTEEVLHWAEAIAAGILVFLFLVGLVDVIIAVAELVVTVIGDNPTEVVELFIDLLEAVLLLLIIIEIYETIVAYAKERSHSRVVRTVIIAGVIAIVRKVIVFRISDYSDPANALIAASSYGVILLGLAIILYVLQRDSGDDEETPTPRSGLDTFRRSSSKGQNDDE